MPEHLLDHPYVGTVGQHVAGTRMTEHVGAHDLAKSDTLRTALHSGPCSLT